MLMRIRKHLDFKKLKHFLSLNFKYCPLTRVFVNRTTNNKINKFHERLTISILVHDVNYTSAFEELLQKT